MNEEQINQLKGIVVKKLLTKEAIERLGRIRVSRPELAEQAELYILQLYQAGRIKKEISDEQLKAILESLSSNKKFRIIK